MNNGNLVCFWAELLQRLMIQFSEASSLIFWSLEMLFTMDDRQRRLEDPEDTLLPENKGDLVLLVYVLLMASEALHLVHLLSVSSWPRWNGQQRSARSLRPFSSGNHRGWSPGGTHTSHVVPTC